MKISRKDAKGAKLFIFAILASLRELFSEELNMPRCATTSDENPRHPRSSASSA
jgi:hypothetical protein